jgi:MoaA/NifB/PqqE/SkfB family radical SAM enzyme
MIHFRVAIKLLANGIRYRCLKLTGRSAPLQAISLEITHRCICRCRMCNIWQIPGEIPDMPLFEWVGLLSSPELSGLREIDITGGEPFLREDLADLLEWVCSAKSTRFPQLRTVAITTNGLLTDRILAVVEPVLAPMRAQGLDLVLACGLDAVGEQHDRIRNHKGAWRKLNATLDALEPLRAGSLNLILGIKTTIIPLNVEALEQIARFAEKHGLFTIISPCIITANRFGNSDLRAAMTLSDAEMQAVMRFYQGPSFAWSGHRLAMLEYLKTGRMKKPCSAGFNTVFVRHTGEVFPCPVIPTLLGNIRQDLLGEVLSCPTAAQFRRHVGTFTACQTCTEPGLERLAWPFEGLTCLRHLLQMGRRDFARLVSHMGLDKYL